MMDLVKKSLDAAELVAWVGLEEPHAFRLQNCVFIARSRLLFRLGRVFSHPLPFAAFRRRCVWLTALGPRESCSAVQDPA